MASSWWYINLDPGTKPNILGDITSIPIKSDSVDIIICTEVLEHLDNPAGCSAEIFRLLRPGGRAYVSAPFIYPIHADPHDYQRFTADGLRNLFKEFSSTEVFRMGGFWGTIGMLLEIGLQGFTGKGFLQKVSRRFLRWLSHQLYAVDLSTGSEQNAVWKQFTTGYFLRIIK